MIGLGRINVGVPVHFSDDDSTLLHLLDALNSTVTQFVLYPLIYSYARRFAFRHFVC